MEVVFIIMLILTGICTLLGNFGPIFFGISRDSSIILYNTGLIFENTFVCILSLSMHHVNKHLAFFFSRVKSRNYPRKSIATLNVAFFVFVIQLNMLVILRNYVSIPKMYFYLSIFLNGIVY